MVDDLESVKREMDVLRRDHADDLAPFLQERWVRVMCDFAVGGVWQKEGSCITAEYLPITPELALRIHRWQKMYGKVFRHDDPDRNEIEEFAAEGLAIAIEKKHQLPDWTVVYHDERRRVRDQIGIDAPYGEAVERFRPWFEFEITQKVMQTRRGPALADVVKPG